MSTQKSRRRKVVRGTVIPLPSGSLRVFVDAGIDPVTGHRHRLTETILASEPDKEAKAEAARVRLINQVNERRNPKTKATVRQLIERYLDQHTGAASTVANYRRDFRKHIEPFLGAKPVAEVDADMLDSLYRELRRCSEHCRGRYVEHRTDTEHVCDDRCGPHRCRPLGVSGIRQVHFILSGAYRKAVKWKWVSENPVQDAEPPPMKPPMPTPPTAEEAAKLVNEAIVGDLDWATMVWLAMITGIRRHELCALRWIDVLTEDEHVSLWIRRGISKDEQGIWAEQDTKTHQQRLVTLDAETVQVLRRHRQRYEDNVRSLGVEPCMDAFLFSAKIDYGIFLTPSAVTQRFGRLVDRLGLVTTIHKLRHYSATELIKAGVDINTVAGRLGHGGGGATTLRVYTAFVSEADQRAAGKLMPRLPASNWEAADPVERAKTDPRKPFERIAAALREEVLRGTYRPGAELPSEKEVTARFDVSAGTSHRAMKLLEAWGFAMVQAGRRTVAAQDETASQEAQPLRDVPREDDGDEDTKNEAASRGAESLDVELIYLGQQVRRLRVQADPTDLDVLTRVLRSAVLRHGGESADIGRYELNVCRVGEQDLITTVAAV